MDIVAALLSLGKHYTDAFEWISYNHAQNAVDVIGITHPASVPYQLLLIKK